MPDVHTVSAVPVCAAAAYSSGDALGTLMEFNFSPFRDRGGFVLETVVMIDQAKQSGNADLILFNANPTGTTITDNGAVDIADADMAKIAGVVPLTTHAVFADNGLAYVNALALPIKLAPAQDGTIYGVLVARSTPTLAAATDIRLILSGRSP